MHYPYVEVLIGCGFFIVYLVEVLAIHISHQQPTNDDANRPECNDCKNDVIE